jgi:hypothetical protein
VAIYQHSLPFLQSESFETHVGTIHRRAIDPLALHNDTSAYTSLTRHLPAPTIECLHRPRYKLTCSSRQSVALRITSNLYWFSDTNCSIAVKVRRLQNTLLWKSTTACLDCCTTMKLGCQVLSHI